MKMETHSIENCDANYIFYFKHKQEKAKTHYKSRSIMNTRQINDNYKSITKIQ